MMQNLADQQPSDANLDVGVTWVGRVFYVAGQLGR